MSFEKETTSTGNTHERKFGRVKWFNNKTGYGFITLQERVSGTESNTETDIFVHHSGIQVGNEQYKYLVQGEYVEFTLDKVENGTHILQATNVSGIHGGKLMCETRNQNKELRTQYAKTHDIPRSRGSGPREEFLSSREERLQQETTQQETTQQHQIQQGSQQKNLNVKRERSVQGEKDWKVVGKEFIPKSRGRPKRNVSQENTVLL